MLGLFAAPHEWGWEVFFQEIQAQPDLQRIPSRA